MTPNQKRLEEVEKLIAQGEKEVAAFEASAEYRDPLAAAEAALKSREADLEEAEAKLAVVRREVLIARRVRSPMGAARWAENPHAWNPDLLAAVEKIAGVSFKNRKKVAQPNRTNGPEADPMRAVLMQVEQQTLEASADYRAAKEARDEARNQIHGVEERVWVVKRRLGKLREEKVDRFGYERRELQNKIDKYEMQKATAGSSRAAPDRTRMIEARRRLLAIVDGKEKLTW